MNKITANNQSAYERVKINIIDKLTTHWGLSFKPDKINDYVVSLGKYEAKTLENAMKFLVENCEDAPRLATIIKACKEHKTIERKNIDPPEVFYKKRQEEEELKMSRAATKAQLYYEQKKREVLGQIEHWSAFKQLDLFEFIAESALYQAYHLEKVKNPGFRTIHIFGRDTSSERIAWWKKMCDEAKDDINVEIPWLWFESKEQAA